MTMRINQLQILSEAELKEIVGTAMALGTAAALAAKNRKAIGRGLGAVGRGLGKAAGAVAGTVAGTAAAAKQGFAAGRDAVGGPALAPAGSQPQPTGNKRQGWSRQEQEKIARAAALGADGVETLANEWPYAAGRDKIVKHIKQEVNKIPDTRRPGDPDIELDFLP